MYKRRRDAEELVQRVVSPADIQRAEEWYALRTPPMREIDAAVLLADLGCLAWCPMQTAWKRRAKGRIKIRMRPTRHAAIVGYIFVAITRGAPDWAGLWATGYIRGLVGVDGRPYPVPKRQLLRVADGQLDNFGARRDSVDPVSVKPGERVRIEEGPFQGLYSRIEAIEDGRLKVLVAMLGAQRFVELKLDAVSKAA